MSGPLLFTTLLAAVSSMLSTGVPPPATDTHSFDRYKIIVDRAPFGAMTGSAADTQQPNFATRFNFIGTAKLSESQPLMAIIQDKEAKDRTYFKSVGDTIGGVTIERIDKSPTAKLVLKQGLETATLTLETKMGTGRSLPPSASAAAGNQPAPQAGQPPAAVPPQGPRRIPFLRGG